MRSLGDWLLHEPLGRNCWYFPIVPMVVAVFLWLLVGWPPGAFVIAFVITSVVDVIARYLWWRSDKRKTEEQVSGKD